MPAVSSCVPQASHVWPTQTQRRIKIPRYNMKCKGLIEILIEMFITFLSTCFNHEICHVWSWNFSCYYDFKKIIKFSCYYDFKKIINFSCFNLHHHNSKIMSFFKIPGACGNVNFFMFRLNIFENYKKKIKATFFIK